MANKSYTHLVGRVFDTPLAINEAKMGVILQFLIPRMGLGQAEEEAPAAETPEPQEPKQRSDLFVNPNGIAIIDVTGTLVRRSGFMNALSGLTSYDQLTAEFEEAVTNPEIKGILFNVDSPGGEISGMFDLVDAIYSARALKPIYAIANDSAFSAAYAIASAAERVFVTRTGGAGSIGVIANHVDVSKANEKAGVKYTSVYAGKRKADMSPNQELSDDARATLQAHIDQMYDLFCGTVSRNRGISIDQVKGGESALFFGADAVKEGLADAVASANEAMRALEMRVAGSGRVGGILGESGPLGVSASVEPLEAAEPEAELVIEEPEAGLECGGTIPGTSMNAPVDPVKTPMVSAADANEICKGVVEGYIERAQEIAELCCMAGLPGMVSQLIKYVGDTETVKKILMAKRVEVDAKTLVVSSVSPANGTEQPQKASDSPVVKACAEMAKRAGKK